MSDGDGPDVELAGDERILWRGYPSRAVLAVSAREFLRIPLSAALAGAVILIAARGWASGARGAVVTMVPLAMFALYLLAGRFVLNWYLRCRTRYVLTTHRVLVLRSVGGRTRVVERNVAEVDQIVKKIERDGSGTIWFDPEPLRLGLFERRRLADWHDTGLNGAQFYRIGDVERVVALISGSTRYSQGLAEDHP